MLYVRNKKIFLLIFQRYIIFCNKRLIKSIIIRLSLKFGGETYIVARDLHCCRRVGLLQERPTLLQERPTLLQESWIVARETYIIARETYIIARESECCKRVGFSLHNRIVHELRSNLHENTIEMLSIIKANKKQVDSFYQVGKHVSTKHF